MKPNRRAFTLVELLVVIAILALLAAILLPVFATVRGKARQAGCQSSLRQIGLAIQMYASDYDGLFPYAKDASDAYVPQIWSSFPSCQAILQAMPFLHPSVYYGKSHREAGALDPYIRSDALWRCAGDVGFDILDNNDNCDGPCPMPARPSMFERYGASYLWRTEVAFRRKGPDSLTGISFSGQEVGPAQINILFDGNGSWHGSAFSFLSKGGLRYLTLFGDGHAKLLTNQQYQEAWAIRLDGAGAFSSPCE